ncbi:glycosyltransferase family 4 protein [Acetobacter fallax]|uniref:Glycosyltransferase n=1 Tax=Acetobacter fallax TaxID=1737473 RepID=A0ABX0K5P3_9PROT|nr:glycosyltransferase family 4 protein [Acetobacter fallax]NHO31077.1 glycosyltransferase [Acetobacter fallax]NHO34634.1 glycosyltransferase [Acetobacter fallax]
MRIAYVINSLEGGGAVAGLKPVASFLQACGHSVTVLALTPRDRQAESWLVSTGFNVITREGGEKDHLGALRWLSHEVRKLAPTHIWTSLTRSTLLGQLVGLQQSIPVVSWQHNAYLKRENLALLKLTRQLSCHWIADSAFVATLTRERLSLPDERVSCWPIFSVSSDALQTRPWRRGEIIRIGSLGRLHPAKGYDVLCEALRLLPRDILPPFEITIGGQGKEKACLLETIRNAGLSCLRLDGFVTDTQDFLAHQHLYLQPSRREGFCIAAHEAMQAGLGVLASSVGELSHSVIDDVTGWKVPPEDPHALAEALIRILQQPERLETVGATARAHVLKEFSHARFQEAGQRALEHIPGGTNSGSVTQSGSNPISVLSDAA